MAAHISPKDYRVKGEKVALYWGFSILAFILLFPATISFGTPTISLGIATLIVVASTAVIVWIQQSQLVGGAAKISEKQFPNIHAIAKEAAERLDMQQPEVFIRQNPTLNAFAIGFWRKKSVVLHSATVEAMEEQELEHIIGHEFSHIKCNHMDLTVLTSSSQGINVPIISQLLRFIFLFWSRKAEYTCDRGGLLASRDPKAAIAAMCKLAVGPALFKQMNIDDFLNQQMALDKNNFAKLSEHLATHPYLVKRVHAIQQYFESNEYKRLTGKNELAPNKPDARDGLQPRVIRDVSTGNPKGTDHLTAPHPRQAGKETTVELPGGVKLGLCWVPQGEFWMGSQSPNGFFRKIFFNEAQHRVTISRSFWMGKYVVTQAQWKDIMGSNPSGFKGDNLPVENVSWNDCQEFIQKLNAKTGKHFRLPTEAEWEYACRAGTTTAYCFGDGAGQLPQYAWYSENSEQTHPVGQKKPNAWGLYDMHGNVWEWCSDWYSKNYYKRSPSTDPTGPSSGGNRVYRGGSWNYDAQHCRSAYRDRYIPSYRSSFLGFRLALAE